MSKIAVSVIDQLRIDIISSTAGVDESIRRLTNNLSKLGQKLGKINADGFSVSMSKAGGQVGGFGMRITSVLGVLGRLGAKIASAAIGMLGLGNAFGLAGKSATSATSRFAALASKIGLIYVALFPLMRLFGLFKKLTGLASDLTEIQNVVDVAFGSMRGKVEDFAKTSIKSFGLSEMSAKRFASQYQAMGVAMGITGKQVQGATKFLQKFKTPLGDTAGYDKASKSMADMSLNLTKLTADMASFYNVDQATMAKALQSGIMAGNTRPLRAYGLDLTQATLQEWAMKQGLDANIKSMTQAEKAMLRYQYVMANAANAQGDFQRTSGTWANQLRILKQQFEQLGIIIGKGLVNAFRPFLRVLNQILAQVISFAEQVYNSLGQIFGWKVEISAGGVTDDLAEAAESAEEAEDASGGTADKLDDAANNAKKLNKQLQGFDKLNNLTTSTPSSSGSGGAGSGGSGSGTGGAGTADAGASGVIAKVTQTESLIKSKLDTLYKLGEWIGQKLTDAMNSIPWNDVYKAVEGFGQGLAEFLNGLISPELFSALGRTIANSLNTALHFLDSFGTTFDWTDLGKSIGAGLNAFFGNIDWGLYIKVNSTFGKGIANAFNAAVNETQFEYIGKAIVGYITGAITKSYSMGVTIDLPRFGEKISDAVNEVIQNAPFYLAGATINVWSTGIFDGLTAAISNIKWEQIPKQISNFISGLKLGEIGTAWGKLTNTMAKSLYALVSNEKTWADIGDGLVEGLSNVLENFGTSGWESAGGSIAKFLSGLVNVLGKLLNETDWKEVGNMVGAGISKMLKDFDWGGAGIAIVGFDTAVVEVIIGLIDSIDWSGIAIAIVKGIGKMFLNANWKSLCKAYWDIGQLPNIIVKSMIDSIVENIKKDETGKLGMILDALKVALKAALASFDLAYEIGKAIGSSSAYNLVLKANLSLIGTAWEFIKNLATNIIDVHIRLAKKGWTTLQEFAGGSVTAWVFRQIASASKTLAYFGGNITAWVIRAISPKSPSLGWFGGSIIASVIRELAKGQKNLQAAFGGKIWAYVKRDLANGQKSLQKVFGGNITAYVKRDLARGQEKLQKAFGGKIWAYVRRTLDDGQSSLQDKFGGTISVAVRLTKGWFGSGLSIIKGWLGLASGGVFENGKWRPIQGYAAGGMPSSSEVFMARENGMPELVGTIGGHTGVMNNDQIVASVSNGVAKAMSESNAILMQQNRILTKILAKEFGISSRDIFNAVRAENQNYINRTGNNAFAL